MRKTITGTGGMLLLQTLKDAGVEYLFTNPGSAETGLFAAIAEDGDNRLVVGKHEGLVAAMADGYHRVSGKVGVVIAHVMGGSHQLAGQLFNAQVAGSSLLVVAGDWASELQDYRGLAPFPGLSQAESMRPITKEARCAYQVHTNPAAISVATIRALREATTPPTGPCTSRSARSCSIAKGWRRRSAKMPTTRSSGRDRRARTRWRRSPGAWARRSARC
jgi:benzoylformate decarboxylase